ncbi:chromate transporter [Paenibacillus yanchengensis]|uniref:Chromate transporter n=1 Tax=Paenibacillus yanchengensis TaxID=2035833 RepID=A0ABW4YIN0_9BACL
MKAKLKLIVQLFLVFLRIGPVTFGGGYAMMALVEREIVTKRKWLSEQEMSNMLAVAGSAPGGVAVNIAAFIGYKLGGSIGATAAVLGIAMPTFVIVLLLSLVYGQIQDHPLVISAMKGIQAAITGLIAVAAYRMYRTAVFDKATFTVATTALALLLIFRMNPIYLIIAGILVGLLIVKVKKQLGLNIATERVFATHQDEQTDQTTKAPRLPKDKQTGVKLNG